jgi:hypothetical protein
MNQAKRIESAVDYLTAVTIFHKSTSQMLNRAELIARAEERRGNVVKPWAMSGFDGFCVGQIQIGSRGHEGIVRLSGALAALEWFEVYQDCDRATRIDIQETYRMGQDPTAWIARQYIRAKKWADEHQPNLKLRLIRDRDGGATCYIGSRQSEICTRIYNKAVESGEEQYESCARVETEFKGKAARTIGLQLTSGQSVQAVISMRLSQILLKYHCHLATPPNPGQLTTGNCSRNPSDASNTCAWLSNATRNSVRLVLDKLGPCALREALGLTTEDLLAMLECQPFDKNERRKDTEQWR